MKSRGVRIPILLGILATLVVLLYSAATAYPYLRGPILIIDMPKQNDSGTILAGRTTRVSAVSINGLPVALDEHGSFSIVRAYPPGYTVVVVSAVDRFGRSRDRTITFVTKPYDVSKKSENESGTSSEDTTTDRGL